MTYQGYNFLFALPFSGQPCSFGRSVYRSVHDSIMPNKTKVILKTASSDTDNKPLRVVRRGSSDSVLSKAIDKNAIIAKYDKDCQEMGNPNQVTTANKGEPTHPPTIYPSTYQLVRGCSMKPDKNHQYRVQDLRIENVIVIVLKFVDGFLSDECIKKLHCLNSLFNEMASDVRKLSTLDFSSLREPRIGYADQQEIQMSRVDMATAGIIH